MPSFTRSEVRTRVSKRASGAFADADFNEIINNVVIDILAEVDLRSTIRKTALSPNLFDDVYTYAAPTDLKGNKVIDIQPQVFSDRVEDDDWELLNSESFDRRKALGGNLISVRTNDFIRKIMVAKPIDDEELSIDTLDAVGDWEGFGDGENLTRDADDYVKGSGSINWDINADGGVTAGIQNTSLDEFDISDYLEDGSVFIWVDLADATDITNLIFRVGNDESNYYYITITTVHDGSAFADGWNLLRFDMSNKSTEGSVTADECDYVAVYMTKDAGKTSETDYRFDNIVFKIGDHYDVRYYSKYGWQNASGTWLEESSNDTDLLNVDTDELSLVIEKALEIVEEHLRNIRGADRHAKKYEQKKEIYEDNNPSDALVETYQYHNI